MLNPSGNLKEPVIFKINKPIMGVDRRSYKNGYYKTRNISQIATLRRIAKVSDRCEEVESYEMETATVVPDKPIGDMIWSELVDMGINMEVFKVGMTKSELIEKIMEARDEIQLNHLS